METEEKENEGPSASIAAVDASHKALQEKIQIKKQERSELKEITQNQLKNISDLQKKCEESFIMTNHLPQTRQAAAEKFNEAMKETTIVQNKQFKVNELLNLSMSEFDETIVLVNLASQQLELQKKLANQRLLIYDADPKELTKLGKKNIIQFAESLESKISFLEELKMFMEQSRIDEHRVELEAIKKKTKDLEILNSDLERKLHLIESNLKSCIENNSAFDRTIESELTSLAKEEESWKIKFEDVEKCLNEINDEFLNVMKATEEEEAIYAALKETFEQEVNNIEVLENDLTTKRNEIEIMKNELSCCISKTSQLKETVLLLNEMRAHCTSTQMNIKYLTDKKEEILHQLDLLKIELSNCSEEISMRENKLSHIYLNIDNLKNTLSAVNNKMKESMEAYEQHKETSEITIRTLRNEIDSASSINDLLEEEVEKKKNLLNDNKNDLALKMEEYEKKKNELIERKEKITNRKKLVAEDQTKLKFEELTKEIDQKKQEICRLKERKETIAELVEKIQIQKNKHKELVEDFEKQKEELKELCINKLEDKLSEMQGFKNEKQKALEIIRDEAGKAEFMYHRLKRQVQQLTGEVNAAKDTCKMYQCENDMLKMLVGWLNSGSQNSTITPDQQQTEEESEDNFSLAGDVHKDLEEMPAPEMSTQQYRRARTLDKTIKEPKKKKPSPMRTKKKTKKKQAKDDYIFNWVLDSGSQLSSE